MKILFNYPAKSYLLDAPRAAPDIVQINGLTLYRYTGLNVYATVSKPVIRATATQSEANDYYVALAGNILVSIGQSESDTRCAERLKAIGLKRLHTFITENQTIAADIDGHNTKLADAFAEKRKLRAEEDAKQQAIREENVQNAKALAAKEEKEAESAFLAGAFIRAEMFESLCKKHGVVMPIQTVGSLRKNVTRIAYDKMEVCGKGRPYGALAAAKLLKDAIKQ